MSRIMRTALQDALHQTQRDGLPLSRMMKMLNPLLLTLAINNDSYHWNLMTLTALQQTLVNDDVTHPQVLMKMLGPGMKDRKENIRVHLNAARPLATAR